MSKIPEKLTRELLAPFFEPPAGSVLAAACSWMKTTARGPDTMTDFMIENMRKLEEQLAIKAGMPPGPREPWLESLFEARVQLSTMVLADNPLETTATTRRIRSAPAAFPSLIGYSCYLRHAKSRPEILPAQNYLIVAEELGPGISADNVRRLVEWWAAYLEMLKRTEPRGLDAVMAALQELGNWDLGKGFGINVRLEEHEWDIWAGRVDSRVLGDA